MKLITTLFNKLPAVRRLRSELVQAQADATANQAAFNAANKDLRALRIDLAAAQGHAEGFRSNRNQLRSELDQLRELVVKQTASIEVLRGQRETDLRLLNEAAVAKAESTQREERFLRTIETLNENCRERMAERDDLQAELQAARAELARGRRPVLFSRAVGMAEEDRIRALAGRGDSEQVKALLDLLDECATLAMSENATRPALPLADGKTFLPGFTDRDREFTSGGVFALVEYKRRALELIAPHLEERKAA